MKTKSGIQYIFLQLFIITLPFIATAIPLPGETLTVSYFFIFILAFLIFINKSSLPVTFDNKTFTLLAFILVAAASTLFRLMHANSATLVSGRGEMLYIKNVKQIISFGIMLLHFIVLRHIFARMKINSLQKIMGLFTSATFIIALYSFYQFFALINNWPYTDILRNNTHYSIVVPEAARGWIGTIGIPLRRTWAFMPEPSFWGTYLLIAIGLLFPFAYNSKNIKNRVVFITLIIALIISFSRSAWAGLMLLSLYFFYVQLRKLRFKLKIPLLLFAALAAALIFGSVYFSKRFDILINAVTFSDWSSSERFGTFGKAFEVFFEHPIIGIGWGNTPFFLKSEVTYNFYVQILLETGIIGFILFILFLTQIYRSLNSFIDKVKDDEEASKLAFGLKMSFLALLIIWINIPTYNFSYIWFILSLIVALPASYNNSKPGVLK
ncbi:MAG: hypothetical protein A2251_05170 [Elusimicrobia bacterium RIFOXYA2_FULL_47_53]|nr:MAG: hypothetical protein A2278_01720 [Elusimicrobia bacterium RIFOXYA12_FULL_49_49]OGS11658.1 MAG: hypothetical protein A2386_03265 [Elusimicrobia bacterium RIFOXYB1_FULL_48_9]OGS16767.1 MAG: hypothetical protein A2251_05170 [Elusimicrobia bacterium RIFOXYA2_FULL_47_53]OGS31995.1 MAG: hypothetical protein A2323_07945 [Elusimicrobia bacterium RIFOXYB2_FULL_46_23]